MGVRLESCLARYHFKEEIMLGTLVVYLAIGLILTIGGIPLAMRKVKPNPWFGLRTKSTMSNERLWYEANACGGRILVVGGLVVILMVIFLFFQDVPAPEREARFSSSAMMLTSADLLVIIVASFLRLYMIKKRLGLR